MIPVMPNHVLIQTITSNLKHSPIYKMSSHLLESILLNCDRARFWGFSNVLESALDGTDIKCRESL